MDRQTEGWSDGPYFIGPFRPSQRSSKLNFLDKCLIYHCLFKDKRVKTMFGACTKALFARYFQKDKSQCTVQLIYAFDNFIFFLVFVTNYPLSLQLLMDIYLVVL